MNREDILKKITTHNEALNDMIQKENLINYLGLDRAIIGKQKYRDIKNDFIFLLNEYRINNFQQSGYDYHKWKLKDLFTKFNISKADYNLFKDGINTILDSYSDARLQQSTKRDILESQLRILIGFPDENEEEKDSLSVDGKSFIRIIKKLNHIHPNKKIKYLDSLLAAMKDTKVNQLRNNEYLIIAILLQAHDTYIEHMDKYDFRKKKDYLKKLEKEDPEKAINKLHEYINDIYRNDENKNEAIKVVNWFLFYLYYGINKFNIYMIHSIIGWENNYSKNLYQKLFIKDHTVGNDEDFLYHTSMPIATIETTIKYKEEPKYNFLYQDVLKYLKK